MMTTLQTSTGFIYQGIPTDDLYALASKGDETALWTLCKNYEPLFRSEASLYQNKMAEMLDIEDFISIGYILIWDIIQKGNFKLDRRTSTSTDPCTPENAPSAFGAYLKQAVRWRYSKTFQDFAMKNYICTGTAEDYYGTTTRTYAISETAEKCRAQAKERSRRYLERKRAKEDAERKAAGLEPRKRPSQMSEEEKAEHKEQQIKKSRERVKRYQQEHKYEIKARKARYYQENKNRYRVRDAIRRTKKSIEKFEAEGRDGMAEKARVRLAGFEKEYAEILKGA